MTGPVSPSVTVGADAGGMTSTRTPGLSAPSPIAKRLGAEWQHLTIRAADLAVVRSWALPGSEIETLDDVLDRCGFRRQHTDGSTAPDPSPACPRSGPEGGDPYDEYVARLLLIARGDGLAARVILQRILPSLCAIARRHSATREQQQALLDELVANAWEAIRSYPVERRPRRIIANLVRDIGFTTIVRPTRRRSFDEIPTTHDRLDSEGIEANDPLSELVQILQEARGHGGISQRDVDLICQLVTLGRPEHLAIALDVSARTIRNHRDAIIHRLRSFVSEAA